MVGTTRSRVSSFMNRFRNWSSFITMEDWKCPVHFSILFSTTHPTRTHDRAPEHVTLLSCRTSNSRFRHLSGDFGECSFCGLFNTFLLSHLVHYSTTVEPFTGQFRSSCAPTSWGNKGTGNLQARSDLLGRGLGSYLVSGTQNFASTHVPKSAPNWSLLIGFILGMSPIIPANRPAATDRGGSYEQFRRIDAKASGNPKGRKTKPKADG
jgi:hypothetical protein